MGWEFYLTGGAVLLVSPFAVLVYAKIAAYGWQLGVHRFRCDLKKGKFSDGT